MKPSKIPKILLVGLALILFCSSCIPILSTKTEMRLSANEKYSLQMIFVLEGQNPMMKSEFQIPMGDLISQAQGLGIKAEWKEITNQSNSSNATYQINLSGTGYDSLNETVFDGQLALCKGSNDDEVVFNFNPPDDSFLRSGEQNSFTLIAGKILTANGSITNNRTVVWTDPSSDLEATVSTAQSLSSITMILIIGILVALIVIGIVLAIGTRIKAGRSKQELAADLPQPAILFCINCSKQVPSQAEFCPFCGERTS